MWKWILTIIGMLIVVPGASGGTDFPSKATYHFLGRGQPIGRNEITFKKKDGKILITSSTRISSDFFNDYEMNSETIVDPTTYRTLLFTYEGFQNGKPVSGQFIMTEDSVFGHIEYDGNEYPWHRKSSGSGIYSIQEYNMEHHILLARAYLKQEKYVSNFQLFFPSSTLLAPAKVSFESERELPVGNRSLLSKKLRVEPRSSITVYQFIDPETELPFYIFFSGSNIEAFLESYFGEHPTSYLKVRETSAEVAK